MMTPEQRAALREVASKATPGPWSSYATSSAADMPLRWTIAGHGATVAQFFATNLPEQEQVANAHYIALAHPAAVLALLDECERMREALKRLADLASFEAGTVNPGQPFWDALAQARAALGNNA